MAVTIRLFAMYELTADGTGATGLTVTVDVDKYAKSDGTKTNVTTGGSAVEGANGIYHYAVANVTDLATHDYVAVFKTAATTVKTKHFAFLLQDLIAAASQVMANLDTTVGSRLASASYTTPPTVGQVSDAVWDEVLSAASHDVATSAGKFLRESAGTVIHSGAVVSATDNTVVLDSGASSINGAYDPALIYINGGTGAGQSRLILEYTGATRTAIVDRDWKAPPDNTSTFVILADAGREHINEGLAQAGSDTTITLNINASAHNDAYTGEVVFIRSGRGANQARRITAYNGTTKVATVDAWAVEPDETSGYVMLPMVAGVPTAGETAAAVWDELAASHLDVGSTGAALASAGSVAGTTVVYAEDLNPVGSDNNIELMLGDDYAAVEGRSLDFTFANRPNLTGASIALRVQVGGTVVSLAGSVLSGTACRVEVTSTQLATIGAGIWTYDLQATLGNGHVVTLVQAQMTVQGDVR